MAFFLDVLVGKTRSWRDWCFCSVVGRCKEKELSVWHAQLLEHNTGVWHCQVLALRSHTLFTYFSYALWNRQRACWNSLSTCTPGLALALVSPGGLMFSDVPRWGNSPNSLGTSSLWANCRLCYVFSFFTCTNQWVCKELEWLNNCHLRRKLQSYFILSPEATGGVNVNTQLSWYDQSCS